MGYPCQRRRLCTPRKLRIKSNCNHINKGINHPLSNSAKMCGISNDCAPCRRRPLAQPAAPTAGRPAPSTASRRARSSPPPPRCAPPAPPPAAPPSAQSRPRDGRAGQRPPGRHADETRHGRRDAPPGREGGGEGGGSACESTHIPGVSTLITGAPPPAATALQAAHAPAVQQRPAVCAAPYSARTSARRAGPGCQRAAPRAGGQLGREERAGRKGGARA